MRNHKHPFRFNMKSLWSNDLLDTLVLKRQVWDYWGAGLSVEDIQTKLMVIHLIDITKKELISYISFIKTGHEKFNF